MASDDDEQLTKEKDVAFYAASVNTWYQTRMEKDKSLLAISSAGVGLLITLLSDVTNWAIWIGVAAVISFIICAITVVIIFQKNSTHIEDVISDEKEPINLECFDKITSLTFGAGIILSLLFTIFNYQIKHGVFMEHSVSKTNQTHENVTKEITTDSVSGASKLKVKYKKDKDDSKDNKKEKD